MKSGVRWKYASAICFSVKFKGGTTEAIAIPSIDLKSSSASEKRFLACTPHSSTVRERAVVSRQCAASISPSKTPRDVLVLPMSITSSIVSLNSRPFQFHPPPRVRRFPLSRFRQPSLPMQHKFDYRAAPLIRESLTRHCNAAAPKHDHSQDALLALHYQTDRARAAKSKPVCPNACLAQSFPLRPDERSRTRATRLHCKARTRRPQLHRATLPACFAAAPPTRGAVAQAPVPRQSSLDRNLARPKPPKSPR